MTSDEKKYSLSEDAAITAAIEKAKAAEHDTLKYHLLGPSLTKAGQDSVDQQKVFTRFTSVEAGLQLTRFVGLRGHL